MLRSARNLLLVPVLTIATAGGALLVDVTAAHAAVVSAVRVGGKLKVRSAPTNSSAVIRQLKNKTQITLECSVPGQYVRGTVRRTAQWDRISGTAQYIPHAYVVSKAWLQACSVLDAQRNAAAARAAALKPTLFVPAGPTGTMTNTQFLSASIAPAQQSQRETRVPASVTLAQAILESGWGRSSLSANDKNFFGMKCFTQGTYASGCRTYITSECTSAGVCSTTSATFRTYASSLNSFRDHGALLATNSRYAPAFNYTRVPNQFAEEIRRAGYATDPLYTSKLVNVMTKYNLYQYNV
jgi:flagellar protein FlgJ